MQINDLLKSTGEWLRTDGPQSDIVVSTRVRLARNLTNFPFTTRASLDDLQKIEQQIHTIVEELFGSENILMVNTEELDEVDRHLLLERHLISRELTEGKPSRAAAIACDETYSLMINEEDHLRIQAVRSGLDLNATYQIVNDLDDKIEQRLPFAFDEKLGYLTACPTNVGTGIRISVMLHLPALGLTGEIEKVFRSLSKINLAVRGMFGEGSQATGDLFQISNQVTLGKSEEQLIEQIGEIIPQIIKYEREARKYLADNKKEMLGDKICRAVGILSNTKTITSQETMQLLSQIRLGVNLGMIHPTTLEEVNELFLRVQPAHLQKFLGNDLDPQDRDVQRANIVREYLGNAQVEDN